MGGVRSDLSELGSRMPPRVQRVARAGAMALGQATVRWRHPPDFLVVGAQRSGTTTLFRLLSEHPGVNRPVVSKGIGYFDLNYLRGADWYSAHFPIRRSRLVGDERRVPLAFESSGYYLFHPCAAARIARDLPEVKVVAMLRNPIDRAHSAHRHESARGFESEDFATALRLEPDRLKGEEARLLADPAYTSFEHRHHGYLGRSRYAEQLERYVRHLGRDRLYALDADLFFADPVGEFLALQRWLGLPEVPPRTAVGRWNSQPPARIDVGLRRDLEDYFRPHDEALTELLGHVPSWR